MNYFLKKILFMYKIFFAQFAGGRCRFYPSCSDYANEALESHSWCRALFLIAGRILRCQPFGKGGFDPVP